jgi:hypothetical protein
MTPLSERRMPFYAVLSRQAVLSRHSCLCTSPLPTVSWPREKSASGPQPKGDPVRTPAPSLAASSRPPGHSVPPSRVRPTFWPNRATHATAGTRRTLVDHIRGVAEQWLELERALVEDAAQGLGRPVTKAGAWVVADHFYTKALGVNLDCFYVANKPLGDGQGRDAIFGPRS